MSQWATRTVKSGVVALRIAASPEAIWAWPQTMSENGTTLLSSPMPRKAAQTPGEPGMREPLAWMTAKRMTAASTTLQATTVRTGKSFTATALKKNEPPQRTDRMISIAQVRGDIGLLADGLVTTPFLPSRTSTGPAR